MSRTRELRKQLTDGFSDEELTFFCYDYYREVHQQFTAGMTMPAMVQLLLEHCERTRQLDMLVVLLRQERPALFELIPQPEIRNSAPAPPPARPEEPVVVVPPTTEPVATSLPPATTAPAVVQTAVPAAQPGFAPATAATSNPYTMGGVVRGANFYGRAQLIEDLLSGNDRAIWVVGCRRIGKSSLLRRAKQIANDRGMLAFFCNMEAADTPEELAHGLLDDLDPNDARLARLGLNETELQGRSLGEIMHLLDRRARAVPVEVLLLFDEAESLLSLVDIQEGALLRDLRVVQQGSEMLRVVLAATKQLEQLNDRTRDWDTSPFLFGVTPRFLGRLALDEAAALIRQTQLGGRVAADDELVAAITAASGGHPFVLQWLCGSRLWADGTLRAPQLDDLIPDSALIDLFQLDYDHLSALERRIFRAVAAHEPVTLAQLQSALGASVAEMQLRYLAQSLGQLCYIERDGDVYRVGNRLLANWLLLGDVAEAEPRMSDQAATEVAELHHSRAT
jgi:hypothetical protein